ncbi:hypothetical protein D3C87_2063050 [compost metagenome]
MRTERAAKARCVPSAIASSRPIEPKIRRFCWSMRKEVMTRPVSHVPWRSGRMRLATFSGSGLVANWK